MRLRLTMIGAITALTLGVCALARPVYAEPPVADHEPAEVKSGPLGAAPGRSHARSAATDASTTWTRAEIEAATARCQIALNNVEAVVIKAEPIRHGGCGAPAPVYLVSIGSDPQIAFSPPPLVTCDLVAALARWLGEDVQPAAREMVGGPVIRLEVMSSYSCRNAYARAKARLSEHAHANAVDVSRFVTEHGETAEVRSDWGDTARDMRAAIAAREATDKLAQPQSATNLSAANSIADTLRGTTAVAETALGTMQAPAAGALSLGFARPSRLGGPRGVREISLDARQRFLKHIHASACRFFGTALGPEANEAHRNHFHLDMADRTASHNFCE